MNLGNEKYWLDSYYVKYKYPNNPPHIMELKAESEDDLFQQIMIHAWYSDYEYELVSEEEYYDYSVDEISKWTVSKSKKNKEIK